MDETETMSGCQWNLMAILRFLATTKTGKSTSLKGNGENSICREIWRQVNWQRRLLKQERTWQNMSPILELTRIMQATIGKARPAIRSGSAWISARPARSIA